MNNKHQSIDTNRFIDRHTRRALNIYIMRSDFDSLRMHQCGIYNMLFVKYSNPSAHKYLENLCHGKDITN